MSTPSPMPSPVPPRDPSTDLRRAIQTEPRTTVHSDDGGRDETTRVAEPAGAEPAVAIDRELVEQGRSFVMPIVFLVIGLATLGFLAIGLWQIPLVCVMLALSFAVVYGYDSFRPVRLRITEESVILSRPRRAIPFADIHAVTCGKAKTSDAFPIFLMLEREFVRLPARFDIDQRDLLRALQSRLTPRPAPEPPALFQAFLRQQRMIHPPDSIHIFHGVPKPIRRGRWRPAVQFAIAMLAPAALWLAIGFASGFRRGAEFLLVAAIISGMFGAIALLVALALWLSPAGHRHAADSFLIVTPDGLALQQHDLKGELRWSEVQSISARSTASTSSSFSYEPRGYGLMIRVKGADILINDCYNWPVDALLPLVERMASLDK